MRFLFVFLFICFQLAAQNADSVWFYNNYTKKEVNIKMRDGINLFTAVYEPKDQSEKHPILMIRTPYSCNPYGLQEFSPRLWKTYLLGYLKEGYIFVIQDVRGRWMSEGVFEDVRPFNKNKKGKETDEASDTYDAVEWLVKNTKNNNGNVGVFGISYPGFYATEAALSNHPAIKAVSPQAPVTEWFLGDDFHHNGALAIMDAFGFYYSFGMPHPKPTKIGSPGYKFPIEDNYAFHLRVGAFKNYEKLFTDSISFWKELSKHPNYDKFWKDRNARVGCYNVKPALMVVGGLFDAEDCYGAWNLYKALKDQSPQTNSRLVMGPWSHGGWGGRATGANLGNILFGSKHSEWYQKNIEMKFFNYYLKNKGSINDLAMANIFFSGENKWYTFNSWPPASSPKQFYLGDNGSLSLDRSTKDKSFTKYISDPKKPVPYAEGVHLGRTKEYMTDDQRFASRRTDVITFQTGVLTEDVKVGGVLKAFLKTAISTTDADFVVKLIDVFPDDFAYDSTYCCKEKDFDQPMGAYQMLVRGEIMRGRYRKSFEYPEAFTPMKIEDVNFELPDVAHTFQKGHRIMVQIQSSWFPLFDRNPQEFVDLYTCNDADFRTSEIWIYHDRINSSYIELPVIK